jgi:uroporphyrinogen-III synthase
MRVLITRPLEDANATAQVLRTRGHEPVVAPLLEICDREGVIVSLDGVQAILATSANGIRALAKNTPHRDVRVFAIGAQTAEAAHVAGFGNVQSADGDAADLASAVGRWATPQGGALLHAAGAQTKGNLAAELTREGFVVPTVTLYDAIAATKFSPEIKTIMADDAIDAALFYSPRTATIFASLAQQSHLRCDGIVALCISHAASDALNALAFRRVHVAVRPNQEALLALLDAVER